MGTRRLKSPETCQVAGEQGGSSSKFIPDGQSLTAQRFRSLRRSDRVWGRPSLVTGASYDISPYSLDKYMQLDLRLTGLRPYSNCYYICMYATTLCSYMRVLRASLLLLSRH